MLIRFAAAAAVASVVIAFASLSLLLISFPSHPAGPYLITTAWCFLPVIWGVWAMVTPRAWPLERLPMWGAILGLLAGTMAAFVLDLPARFAGANLALWQRILVLPVAMVIYYLLWILVRRACENLSGRSVA